MADIFISYSHKDQNYVRELAVYLKNEGLSVWVDDRIDHGDRWWQTIVANIRKCDAMIVVMTPESEETEWVEREYFFAAKIKKPLFPLLLKGDCFPFFLNQQYHELRDGSMPPKKFIASLRRLVGQKNKEKRKKEIDAFISGETNSTFNNSIGMKFILIPAGSFMMGSQLSLEEVVQKYGEESEWFEDGHPQHKVTISKPFYLQSTQVTQSQWERIMRDNPSGFKKGGDNCPVENVSWYDAQNFMKNLNEEEKTDKYRLPTEAEWEYACRAGTSTEFSFGEDADKIDDYAWYIANSEKKTHPVGQKKPNSWGIYDMNGNIWEWCQDWFGDYPSKSVVDPKGPDNGTFRVLRGASWIDEAGLIRSASRYWDVPDNRNNNLGFRVGRDF
jgi:formylglycine-generating enzyme required for sulfatase activity